MMGSGGTVIPHALTSGDSTTRGSMVGVAEGAAVGAPVATHLTGASSSLLPLLLLLLVVASFVHDPPLLQVRTPAVTSKVYVWSSGNDTLPVLPPSASSVPVKSGRPFAHVPEMLVEETEKVTAPLL